jgi:hypothetical protein
MYALFPFICVSSSGMVFDNRRRGFIKGVIGGGALNIWNQSAGDFKSDNETDFAVYTDFRIGGGFRGDKFMLYFWMPLNWFAMENVLGDKVIIWSGNAGVGASYYFKSVSPSLYVNG